VTRRRRLGGIGSTLSTVSIAARRNSLTCASVISSVCMTVIARVSSFTPITMQGAESIIADEVWNRRNSRLMIVSAFSRARPISAIPSSAFA
jgi:hypothetical protein